MSSSFSLSLELVLLMSWLLKNEKETLDKLIKKALKGGLEKEIDLIDTFTQQELLEMDSDFSQELHNSILDFLMYLEDMLLDGLDAKEHDSDKKELSPALQKISKQKIDSKTVLLSLKHTNNQMSQAKKDKNSTKNVNELLFSEILKNWIPKTNEPIN